jgi:archaellum component FlaC
MISIEDWVPLVSAASQITKAVIETWMADKTMKEEQKKDFFKHYRKHSVQLVDAFKKWGEHPNAFSSCEYMDGRLEKKPAIKYRHIPFMQYMIIHVEKSYPELFEFITNIANDHDDICTQIHDIMEFYTPVTNEQPSFEKMIIDKIASRCPGLKATFNKGGIEDNIYISDYVFRKVFDTVESKESSIVLTERPINHNRTSLWYRDTHLLGQGDNTTIKNLKKTLEELVLDINIKKRVQQYNEFYTKLMTDERINQLQNHIDYLHEFIQGGQPLAGHPGFPICDLCNLSNINP